VSGIELAGLDGPLAAIETRLDAIESGIKQLLNGARPSEWLGVAEASEYLGVSKASLRTKAARGRIPVHRDGAGQYRWRRSELDEYARAGDP
jgi:excisionase family DNA binding protein